jgi:hypothetical protein
VRARKDALEIESAKLDREEEQAMADESYVADIDGGRRPNAPLAKRFAILVCASSACGLLLALRETKERGYVVGYDAAAILFIAGAVLVVSLALLLPRRSRSVGLAGVLVVVSLGITFYVAVIVATKLGAWDAPMVRFGPELPANVVVLFREDASAAQIESFAETVISVPNPGGGTDLLPGLESLLKVDVGGHQGYALQFARSASQRQRAEVRRRVASSAISWRIFENIAPQKIVLPSR